MHGAGAQSIANFSDFYIQNGEIQKGQRIVNEMEKIEEEFHTSYEAAREYLDSRRDEASSVASDILSIDLLQRMDITEDGSETSQKETMLAVPPRTLTEVTFSSHGKNSIDPMSASITNKHVRPNAISNETELINNLDQIPRSHTPNPRSQTVLRQDAPQQTYTATMHTTHSLPHAETLEHSNGQ